MRERGGNPEEARFWMKLGAGIVVVLMLTVWEHVRANGLAKEVKTLRKDVDRLTYENGRMQMQINQWTSPSHLDAIARKEFGMAPIDGEHIIGIPKP
jgi:cell division protein FtsL